MYFSELYEGLKRAQMSRLDDQRGTEINFELPDFLKSDQNQVNFYRLLSFLNIVFDMFNQQGIVLVIESYFPRPSSFLVKNSNQNRLQS